ncbi:MAG TPA: uracil-DNA glycosylase [Candidatus Paceibacterota bacterium]|nr:uracil-DNA glycosylase [Candidatus Paceibacterota bacterium]HMP19046.1 uracil-DNA glycosylase [Candidatus Paceibacterota bacterium]HMP85189.1 uracil-DNA glycosylase [Candidatus Paceibacterota bacterium]
MKQQKFSSKLSEMKKIRDDIFNLKKSPLYAERITNKSFPVIGSGNHDAKIMFIGEAPGKNEAKTGQPFCGASGKILDELLKHISISREDVYVTNIIKDRPTNNRDPKPEEIKLYGPFLDKQIQIIKPEIIATLGRFSMKYVMEKFDLKKELNTISKIHGQKFEVKNTTSFFGENIQLKIIPLYHPAVAIYNRNTLPDLKKDFEILKKELK